MLCAPSRICRVLLARPLSRACFVVRGNADQSNARVRGRLVDLERLPLRRALFVVIPTEMLEKNRLLSRATTALNTAACKVASWMSRLRAPPKSANTTGSSRSISSTSARSPEGPIPPGVKGWNFLVAARRSYVYAWLGPTLRAAGAGVTHAPVYYDYQAMAARRADAQLVLPYRLHRIGRPPQAPPRPGLLRALSPALSGTFLGLSTSFSCRPLH